MGRAKRAVKETVKGSTSKSPTPDSAAAMSVNGSPKEVKHYIFIILFGDQFNPTPVQGGRFLPPLPKNGNNS